jgi:hypothetical protein
MLGTALLSDKSLGAFARADLLVSRAPSLTRLANG